MIGNGDAPPLCRHCGQVIPTGARCSRPATMSEQLKGMTDEERAYLQAKADGRIPECTSWNEWRIANGTHPAAPEAHAEPLTDIVERFCNFNCDAESSCRCGAHEVYRAAVAQHAAQQAEVDGAKLVAKQMQERLEACQSERAAQQAAIRALEQKWHERSQEQMRENEFLVSPGLGAQRCADELARLLAEPVPGEKP